MGQIKMMDTNTTDINTEGLSEESTIFTLKVLSLATFKTLGELYSNQKTNPADFLVKEVAKYSEIHKASTNQTALLDALIATLNKEFEVAAKNVMPKKAFLMRADDLLSRDILPSNGGSRIDFFMSVITEVVKQTVKSVEVINNKIVSVKIHFTGNSDHSNNFQDRHLVTVGFAFGEQDWRVDVFDSNPEIRAAIHINGEIKTKPSGDERLLCSLFNSVALYISIEEALNIENEEESKNPVILSKAKMMAEILGGDFRNYLSSALELHAASRPHDDKDAVSDNDLASIIQNEHRCTSNQAYQVVMIFSEKPKYH